MTNRRRRTWVLAALGSAILLAVAAQRLRTDQASHTLEIHLQASAGSAAQLYWDSGDGFSEAHSIRLPLTPASGDLQRLRFPLPPLNLLGVRFDPTDAPTDVWISDIRVVDSTGRVASTLNPASLFPMHHVASMQPATPGVHLVTSGNDPFLLMTAECVMVPTDRIGLSRVTPLSLTLVTTLVIVLLAAALLAVAPDLFRRDAAAVDGSGQPRFLLAGWLAVIFLTSFSAKLLLMHYYPARIPYADQWWSEARGLYIPFNDGCLSWREMYSLHNEHRVFFTRLIALVLLLVNGQWDPQVQQVVNGALHAGTAVLLAGMIWIAGGRKRIDLIALAVGVVFTLPFAWENTLAGFQSAFYFLLLFTVLALWLTIRHAPGSWRWLLGWLFALCSLFTSAGGLITPVALLAAPALRFVTGRQRWKELGLDIGAAIGVIVVGLALTSPPLPHHAPYRAGTAGALAMALARNAAWPWIDAPALSVPMWLPVLAMVLISVRRAKPATQLEQLSLALALWTALQALALAYARGVGGAAPASRYTDILSFGFIANAMAFLAIHDRFAGQPFKARLTMGVLFSWLVFALVGMGGITEEALRTGASTRRAWMESHTSNLREFMRTDDLSVLAAHTYPLQLPFPDALLLANAWLRHPYLRGVLPSDIREPLKIALDSRNDGSFVPDGVYPTTPIDAGRRSIGSFTSVGNPSVGRFESRRLQPCHGTKFLKFEIAGYLGEPELSLALREVASGRQHDVRAPRLARERWMGASVSCPDEPYTVVAEDRRSDYWFAFREPVEAGWMTVAADGLVARALGLLIIAVAAACIVLRLT